MNAAFKLGLGTCLPLLLCTVGVRSQQSAPAPVEKQKAPTPAATFALWSFRPIRKSPVPKSKFDALAVTPVDRFVFARLEEKGLHPSPPASRRELLRRVTVDLTGLPPTPQEIAAFLNDKSPAAYEKVVDRLLASPAYGERQARFWLDVVRYGESHGYEQNHVRPNAYHYRDYVIRAFNQDKPYNQFVTEQLAGDIVGKGSPEKEPATGFLVAGIHDTVGISTEDGTRQQRANDLDDMVTTTGATFLGLTVGCAKCHDHKFDPVPQRDYYRMAAVFADVRHGERPLPSRNLPNAQERERQQQRLETLNRDLTTLDAEILSLLPADHPARLRQRLAHNPKRNEVRFAPTNARYVRFQIDSAADGSQPCIDELQVFAPDSKRNLALASEGAKATASSLLPGYPIHQIAHLNDGLFGNSHSWISEQAIGWAQIEFLTPVRIGSVIWGRDAEGKLTDRVANRYRIQVSDNGQQWETVAYVEDTSLPDMLTLTGDEKQDGALGERLKRRQILVADRDKILVQEKNAERAPMAYIGQFTVPDPIYVLKRGDVMQRGEQVAPGALSLLSALPSDLSGPARVTGPSMPSVPQKGVRTATLEKADANAPAANGTSSRLALARWITDRRNPLTSRVIVNRIWAQHFGRGLVGSPSDFGNNGERSSHPELLDWLAEEFQGVGGRVWGVGKGQRPEARGQSKISTSTPYPLPPTPYAPYSLKVLHKLLVMSYTYRQGSGVDTKNAQKDADNRYLWRMPLRRMEAEAVRDAILFASGKLNRTMYGPSFKLYKYEVVNVAIYTPLEEQGPETWRRTIYQMPARGIRDSLLTTFDCPDSSERSARRSSTTTALQALTLLNGKFLTEQAGFLAERVQKEAGTSAEWQIRRAFLLTFGRPPDAQEQKASAALFAEHGLLTLCRALLNANEFLYY